MIVTHHSGHFIKLQAGDTIVAINPISKSSKLKTTKFGADIALLSANHPDLNGIEEVTFGSKIPFVARGPGEYEVKGIFVKGFLSKGPEESINTIYSLLFDGIHVATLGVLASEELSEDALESMPDLDILFISVGGDALPPAKAYKLAITLEPKMIIPLGDDSDVKAFIKESGTTAETLDKLTVKKKDFEGKQGKIVVLTS